MLRQPTLDGEPHGRQQHANETQDRLKIKPREPRQNHPLKDLRAESISALDQGSKWQAGWERMKTFARERRSPMTGLKSREIEYTGNNQRDLKYDFNAYRKWFRRQVQMDNSPDNPDDSPDNPDDSPTD